MTYFKPGVFGYHVPIIINQNLTHRHPKKISIPTLHCYMVPNRLNVYHITYKFLVSALNYTVIIKKKDRKKNNNG